MDHITIYINISLSILSLWMIYIYSWSTFYSMLFTQVVFLSIALLFINQTPPADEAYIYAFIITLLGLIWGVVGILLLHLKKMVTPLGEMKKEDNSE